ncbi:MAG TPA: secondary thiamine-phosphate synthase enzyme YjbQ [Bryobacteraceae bacterium]|nr:secondary thiamine-phosphate synthase enzyme YjbQ [Bryobacteraceae bacterium]
MKQFTHHLQVATRGKGLYPITREIETWTEGRGIRTGLLTIFIQHTSASLTIQENADPDVVRDLDEFFERLAPEGAAWYRHITEGADDMPAHIRAALTQTQLTIPLVDGRLALGTWQGIYVFEHRARSHRRSIVLHLAGE